MPATTKQDSIPEKKIIKAFSIRSEWDIKENIPKMYIDFIDTTTGAVLKRIDLIKENPYTANAIINIKKIKSDGTVVYLTFQGGNKSVIKQFLPAEKYEQIPINNIDENAMTSARANLDASNYVTISYIFEWWGTEREWQRGDYATSIIVVYDRSGKEIFRQQFDGVAGGVTTNDGKYLLVSTGDNEHIGTASYRIIDMQNNKIIYQIKEDDVYSDTKFNHYDKNFYRITFSYEKSNAWYYNYFVSHNSTLYSIKMLPKSYVEYEALEYVIIRNYEKVDEIKEYKLYFDKDFQTIKLK